MGLISQFILPKTVDFDNALQSQAGIMLNMLEDLYIASKENDMNLLSRIPLHAEKAHAMKSANMKELLDVFITPYDKESIYRIITQLDWVTLSVKHLQLEIDTYETESIEQYQPIIKQLLDMATLLKQCVDQLSAKNPITIAPKIAMINDHYDEAVISCAEFVAQLLEQQDFKAIIRQRDLLAQLKEIAKRIHVSAYTLEDMAIKVV
ncbi:MAG: hypothetical protein DRQ61_09695 [Gammaproteobacteria bacterium]|nr:MAG: hypothetical protein DRQ61_09695 [Gammaproteobacteria bacterium]